MAAKRGPRARPGVLDIGPYVPGTSALPGAHPVIKLSSNETPFGPSPRAIEAYLAAAASLSRYPDGSARALREAIAKLYGLDAARIVCGAGSDEVLNLLAGARQALGAAAIFTSSLVVFSVLSFGVIQPPAGGRALDGGTYGVRRCAAPAKQVYLVFSSSCPHCAEVLRTLESCNSCNFHFNPIDQIPGLDLPGVERAASYDPGVNRGLLALLGIEEVPVLLVPGPEGMSIIRGEKRILSYIRAECFRASPVLNIDPSRLLGGGGALELFRDEKDDGCNVKVDCPPGEQPKNQSSR